MKKGTRIFKQYLATFLIVLMSIESFAAVVGDNDGAAFITKAEFDSMKNDFQSQLDRYNSSIDNKIDGAIASYLAGIKIASVREFDPLIPNYNEMIWMNDLKLYGKYTQFNSSHIRTHESTTDEWFSPVLDERRVSLVNRGNFKIWDYLQQSDYTLGVVQINGTVDDFDGATYCAPWSIRYADQDSYAWPVGCIKIKLDDRDGTTVDPDAFYNWEGFLPTMTSLPDNPTYIDSQSGTGHAWWSANQLVDLTDFTILTPGDNEWVKYQFNLKINARYSSYGSPTYVFQNALNTKKALWPLPNGWYSMVKKSSLDYYEQWDEYKDNPDASGNANAKWWRDGVTWQYIDESTGSRQLHAFQNLMYGNDTDKKANIIRPLSTKSPAYTTWDFAGYPDTVRFKFKANQVDMMIFKGNYSNSSAIEKTVATDGWVVMPLLPQEYLKNLSSGNFVYKNKNIKMGEGLILIDDIENKGDLSINFDYRIGYLLNNTDYTTTQDLYFDLKKTSFLAPTVETDYLSGWEGNRSENIARIKFKSHKYSSRTGKVSLTVPIEKGNNVYIRLRPSNEDGGYYTQISNLRITNTIE